MDRLALIFQHKTFHSSENVTHFIRAAFGQQRHKFISAQAHSEIRTANRALEAFRETFDHEITGCVTVAVVHGFQLVQIEKQDCERHGRIAARG